MVKILLREKIQLEKFNHAIVLFLTTSICFLEETISKPIVMRFRFQITATNKLFKMEAS